MKILIMSWRDPRHPLAGGAEISLFEHAKYWQKKGADITWFASSFNDASENETYEGIKIIRKGSHFTVHLHAFIHKLRRKFLDPDVIIDSFHFLPFFSPLYFPRKKVIALINEPAKNAWFKNLIPPLSLVGYCAEPFFFIPYKGIPFIVGAESIALELTQDFGIKSQNVHIIHHGIDIPKQKNKIIKEKNPTIIFASRITPDKGIKDAVLAVSNINKKLRNIQFWIIGKYETESYLNEVKKLISESGLDSNTKIYGYVSNQKKFELLSKSWVLVHPSVREGWGLNVIEANGMHTPAVGYDVTGLRDSIKDNKTGQLAIPGSVIDLSKKLEKMLLDQSLRKVYADQAFSWSQEFSWEKAGRKSWMLIYEVHKKNANLHDNG